MWDKAGFSFNISYILIRGKSLNPKGCHWVQTQSWSRARWAWISGAINLQLSICKYAGDWVSRKNNFKHLWYSFCSRLITLLVCWCWPEFSILWCYAWNAMSILLCVYHLMKLNLHHRLSFRLYFRSQFGTFTHLSHIPILPFTQSNMQFISIFFSWAFIITFERYLVNTQSHTHTHTHTSFNQNDDMNENPSMLFNHLERLIIIFNQLWLLCQLKEY